MCVINCLQICTTNRISDVKRLISKFFLPSYFFCHIIPEVFNVKATFEYEKGLFHDSFSIPIILTLLNIIEYLL